MLINQILELEIKIVAPMETEESQYLIRQLETAELAKDKFLKNQISFQDYIDILEVCDIDIDNYLITLEDNLKEQCLL
jgi:hypothetical protein